jgi:hypothetical protein
MDGESSSHWPLCCPTWRHAAIVHGHGGANGPGFQNKLPESFGDALDEVTAFADPVLDGTVQMAVWNVEARSVSDSSSS